MDFSDKVKMQPWIGNKYFDNDFKIMLLGESVYYDNGCPAKERAQRYVESAIAKKGWSKFFNNIHKCYSWEDHWHETEEDTYDLDKEQFWNDVCFFEYVQDLLDSSSTRPTLKQWRDAQEPFLEVLKKLQPDVVIALGFLTYSNLPSLGYQGKDYTHPAHPDTILETWIYPINNKEIHVLKTKHPSRAFQSDVWIDISGVALNDIRNNFDKSQ